MTYSNYPFNVIWAIVNVSSAISRTFSASLTQKHQLTKSQRSKHSVGTDWQRAFESRAGHFNFGIGYPELSVTGCEGARVRLCGRCATTRTQWAPAEGRSSPSRGKLPASLRKSPIAPVHSLNNYFTFTRVLSIMQSAAPPEKDCFQNTFEMRMFARFLKSFRLKL